MLDGENILDPEHGPQRCCAPASAWCSRSRRRSRCRSTTISPSACGSTRSLSSADMDERVEEALRRAALWDEVKDKLNASRPGPVRRPAAAPVHRPRHRRSSPEVILLDEPCLGARPDLHRQDRGADRRIARTTTPSSSSPTTCSRRRASSRLHRPSCIWASWSNSARPTRSSPTPAGTPTQDYITGRFG